MTEQFYSPPPGAFAPPPRPPKTSSIAKTIAIVAAISVALLLALAVAAWVAFSSRAAQVEAARQARELEQRRAMVPSGVRVTEIAPFSKAASVGLEAGDIVVAYDGARVYDAATYRAAISAATAAGKKTVELTVARGNETVRLTAPSGLLGFVYQPWTLLKAAITVQIRNKDRDRAAEMIAEAEREGTLSPTQLLVVKIQAIDDDAGPEESARRDELVGRLIASCPARELAALAFDEFDKFGSLRAAVPLYSRVLEAEPDNVGVRLNLANALALVGRVDDAERELMVEFGKPAPPLTAHGFSVAERILGVVSVGRKAYGDAAAHFRRSIEHETKPEGWGIQLQYMYSAGRSGGLAEFERVRDFCRGFAGENTAKWQCHIDAVEASLLVEAGRHDEAAALVARWRDDEHARVNVGQFWAQRYLGAPEVAKAWTTLLEAD